MRVMVFMMGLPGSGKSTVADRMYAGLPRIDADAIKATHPNYAPERAQEVHDWSLEVFELQWLAALSAGESVVVDGTGTHADTMVRRMTMAKAAGFEVRVLYVQTTLKTALERAKQRERETGRHMPPEVIRQKARDIGTSFEIVSRYADSVQVVDNEGAR